MSQDDVEPQRVSPDLIAKLNALASRLTQMGEYDAVDLIDTVVARVTAMPPRELLADALEALDGLLAEEMIYTGAIMETLEASEMHPELTARARAAADKIRAAMEYQQKGEGL